MALTQEVMSDLTAGPLRERAIDEAFTLELIDEMLALDSTDMANQVLAEFLSGDPPPLDWQIGEAVAEVLLKEWHGAIWIWNASRDRKTAKASLPGADLSGFVSEQGQVCFLFGEVKLEPRPKLATKCSLRALGAERSARATVRRERPLEPH